MLSSAKILAVAKYMEEINPIFLTTTIINRLRGETALGTATGFFYLKEKKVYLITNKHVLYGENFASKDASTKVDRLGVVLHTNRKDLRTNEEVVIDLFADGEKLWLEHSQIDTDVVCIPVEIDRDKYALVTDDDGIVDVGKIQVFFEQIFVMGYPFGWYDDKFNLPITRIGYLSSPYKVPFKGKPFLLGDVETHKGMSGSPVFMYLKDYITKEEDGKSTMNLGQIKLILLGVYSGQPIWRVKDKTTQEEKDIPHSLCAVWFSSLIREIIEGK